MITGGFNDERADTGDSVSLDDFVAGNGWKCVSRGHDEATTAASGEKYDQYCVTPGLDDEYVDDSFDVRREIAGVFPRMFRQTISKHCPVMVRLNDMDTDGAAAAGDWEKD